jgi:hypothetical protein
VHPSPSGHKTVRTLKITFNLNFSHFFEGQEYYIAEPYIFQIHGTVGGHNESSIVWGIPYFVIGDVSGCFLHGHGKYLSLSYNIFNDAFVHVIYLSAVR